MAPSLLCFQGVEAETRPKPLEEQLKAFSVKLEGFQVFFDPTAKNKVWSDFGAMPRLSASGW
jgi:hypothetical protein